MEVKDAMKISMFAICKRDNSKTQKLDVLRTIGIIGCVSTVKPTHLRSTFSESFEKSDN